MYKVGYCWASVGLDDKPCPLYNQDEATACGGGYDCRHRTQEPMQCGNREDEFTRIGLCRDCYEKIR